MFINHPKTCHLTSYHRIMITIDSQSWQEESVRCRLAKVKSVPAKGSEAGNDMSARNDQ